MKELSLSECQFISGGFPEKEYGGETDKVLTKEDIRFIATFGIFFGGITGLIKYSSSPLLAMALGATLGGMILPITAHYLGKIMIAAYEATGVM